MAASGCWLAWIAVIGGGSTILVLPFSAYLLHKATTIFGFFAIGPQPPSIDALLTGHRTPASLERRPRADSS